MEKKAIKGGIMLCENLFLLKEKILFFLILGINSLKLIFIFLKFFNWSKQLIISENSAYPIFNLRGSTLGLVLLRVIL